MKFKLLKIYFEIIYSCFMCRTPKISKTLYLSANGYYFLRISLIVINYFNFISIKTIFNN